MNGTGLMKYDDGSYYVGSWKNGMKNGIGKQVEANKVSIFKGNWKEGKKNGTG